MKKRFSHNATIQQKLVLTLLLSILTPMIIFGSIFRIYSRREFNAQTLSSIRTGFQSSINSFQDQLQLITYAERSFYSNEKVQTALFGDGHYDSIAERQAVEDYIFYLLRSINSMVTDASIIHLSAYIRTWKSSKGNCAERPPICVSSMLFNIWRTIMLSHSARRNVLHAFV